MKAKKDKEMRKLVKRMKRGLVKRRQQRVSRLLSPLVVKDKMAFRKTSFFSQDSTMNTTYNASLNLPNFCDTASPSYEKVLHTAKQGAFMDQK